jgi:hypothetical protein
MAAGVGDHVYMTCWVGRVPAAQEVGGVVPLGGLAPHLHIFKESR